MDPSADWLGDADRVACLGRRLAGSGVPVARLALYRRTLHPGVLARATAWAPDGPVEIFDREHGLELSAGFVGSPLDSAIAGGGCVTLTAAELGGTDGRWSRPLLGFSLEIILLMPLRRNAALAVGTRRQTGFAEADLVLIAKLSGMLAKSAKRSRAIPQ